MAIPLGGYDYPHGVSLRPFTSPHIGDKTQFNKLRFVLSYMYMNFKVSFIALFIALIAFVGVPHEVEAYDTCSFSGAPYYEPVTVPCTFAGKTHDSYVTFTIEGTGYFTWLFSLENVDIFVGLSTTTATSNQTDYNKFGSFFYNGSGGGETANMSWANNELIDFSDNLDLTLVNLFELEFYLSAFDENNVSENTGCVTSENLATACAIPTPVYGVVIQSTSSSPYTPWKYEFLMTDIDENVIEPQGAYSKLFLYDILTTRYNSNPIVFPTMEKGAYTLDVCVSDTAYYYLVFGWTNHDTNGICKRMWIGNGYTSEEFLLLLSNLGKISSSTIVTSASLWDSNGCDDIGLDIFKGVKCAFIWAFEPNKESINKFNQAKESVLTTYPIGYATLILSDVTSAFTSTSTSAFDKDIDVKKFFGQTGGTTTISVSALTSKMGMVQPIIDYFNLILWFGFVGWLLWWGLTRKL